MQTFIKWAKKPWVILIAVFVVGIFVGNALGTSTGKADQKTSDGYVIAQLRSKLAEKPKVVTKTKIVRVHDKPKPPATTTTTTATPSGDPAASWKYAVELDIPPVQEDLFAVNAATTAHDVSGAVAACDTVREDTQFALENTLPVPWPQLTASWTTFLNETIAGASECVSGNFSAATTHWNAAGAALSSAKSILASVGYSEIGI